MHTYQTERGTYFTFNSDLSGDVQILTIKGDKCQVPGEDLLQFIGEHVRAERISRLETLTYRQVLGVEE